MTDIFLKYFEESPHRSRIMYAVITGASSGFGVEFARQFAKRKYDLCIAARRKDRLAALKKELESRYGIKVDIVQADLSTEKGLNKLYTFTKKKKVDILINNSGIATNGMPDKVDFEREIQMLNINVKAMHYLMRVYLKDMLAQNSGRILNVSSLSAWRPIPGLAAYAAGKAYILHLSEGVSAELRYMKTNVTLSVVTPGFFNTEIAGKDAQMTEQGRSIPDFIEKVVEQFLQGKEIILLGQDRKIMFMDRLLPRTVVKQLLFKAVRKSIVKKKK
jgi:hypothetical protein